MAVADADGFTAADQFFTKEVVFAVLQEVGGQAVFGFCADVSGEGSVGIEYPVGEKAADIAQEGGVIEQSLTVLAEVDAQTIGGFECLDHVIGRQFPERGYFPEDFKGIRRSKGNIGSLRADGEEAAFAADQKEEVF